MTEKLNWDYSGNKQVAKYKGFTITAEVDQSPSNPLEDWDGNWPLCVRSPDGYRSTSFRNYDKLSGAELQEAICWFNDAQLVHDQRAITEVLGFKTVYDVVECHGNSEDCVTKADTPRKYFRDAAALREAFAEALADVSDSDRLETCAKLYRIAGIPAFCTTLTGYSQGDWAELLVVALPASRTAFGREDVTEAELGGTAELWSSWAWGDVYGWVVSTDADDHLDSCWGYYGSDHGESGLEESAMEAVDGRLAAARRARIAKLKELLRAHVPLDLRAELLDAVYARELEAA